MSNHPLSNAELQQLVAGLLFDRKCALSAKRNLAPDMFNRPFEEAYRILWSVTVEHLAAYGKMPTYVGLLTGLRTNIERSPGLLPMEQQMMHTLLQLQELGDRHNIDRMVVTQALIPRFLADRFIRPLAAGMDLSNPDKVRELNHAVASMQTVKSPKANVLDFDNQAPVMPNPGRATGFEFFDMMTTRTAADPGGLRQRNCLGVLGGFGAGKTLFGIEAQCKSAQNNLRSVNFHYEQSVEEDLRGRFWANLTGISSAEFAAKPNYNDHGPEVREQLDAQRHLMPLMEVCDMRAINGQGTGGPQDIVNYLIDYRERVGEDLDRRGREGAVEMQMVLDLGKSGEERLELLVPDQM